MKNPTETPTVLNDTQLKMNRTTCGSCFKPGALPFVFHDGIELTLCQKCAEDQAKVDTLCGFFEAEIEASMEKLRTFWAPVMGSKLVESAIAQTLCVIEDRVQEAYQEARRQERHAHTQAVD